jgi:ABC-2 type transport system permease protein
MREQEFRFNLLIWTVMDFIFFGLTVVSVELIFGQVDSIAGWSREEVLLLICVHGLFFDFLWTFILQNLLSFSHYIRKGELDFALLKPVNLRFLVSTRYFEFDHWLRIIFLIFLLFKLLRRIPVQLTIFSWLNFSLLFFLGLFIFYNFYFMITTTNFWFINIYNLEDLFHEISQVGRVPVYVFQRGMRFIFTYIIPVAFIATFPVQVLLGRSDSKITVLALVLALISFFLSQKFWNFALKHYSSASS